jgi:hypothetical protein
MEHTMHFKTVVVQLKGILIKFCLNKIIRTRKIGSTQSIHSAVLTLSSVPSNYSKEFCNAALCCNRNFSKKIVRHKTYEIVLRNTIRASTLYSLDTDAVAK